MNDVPRCTSSPIMSRLEKKDATNASSATIQSITLRLQREDTKYGISSKELKTIHYHHYGAEN